MVATFPSVLPSLPPILPQPHLPGQSNRFTNSNLSTSILLSDFGFFDELHFSGYLHETKDVAAQTTRQQGGPPVPPPPLSRAARSFWAGKIKEGRGVAAAAATTGGTY